MPIASAQTVIEAHSDKRCECTYHQATALKLTHAWFRHSPSAVCAIGTWGGTTASVHTDWTTTFGAAGKYINMATRMEAAHIVCASSMVLKVPDPCSPSGMTRGPIMYPRLTPTYGATDRSAVTVARWRDENHISACTGPLNDSHCNRVPNCSSTFGKFSSAYVVCI